ncbi:MAG: ATP-binding cassette domain-containing protein, partial [Pseudomonadota bacterium]|nr:ATP-binding cassette domain-containing protein [Pseudomonadota bacterium]
MKQTSGQGYLLEARKVSKSFGDFTANDGIDFAIRPGEILALLGENGAGKSTFVKMIYGLLRPDSGGFFWQSEPLSLSSPQQAREMGIGMVFQHFSLFEMLTVAENIELALQGAHDRSRLAELIIEKSTAYGIPLDPDSLVADLSVSQRQRVEILRCLLQNPKLLIMDEPTSVLTPQEANQLFDVIEQLAGSGCAVLFISHKLDEVKRLTKRAVILRGGRKVADVDSKKQSAGELAALMVGDEVAHIKRQSAPKQSLPRLSITSLSRPAEGPFNVALKQIDMIVNQGEILGIAGIAGNGQTELMDAL